MANSFYITAAIPYVNGKPHLGHVLEWFQADAIARYQRSIGKSVTFTCGTDENSLKNVLAAEKAGLSTQEWLDTYAEIFKDAFRTFDITLTHFQRGSDSEQHWPGVQKLWNACMASGDIYQKDYTGLYCVGCEAYYAESELVEGLCPEHLTKPVEITEKNYFFRLSKYQDRIRSAIESDELLIISDQYKQEMLGFISQGLEDFSISRSIQRARGIGVSVPNDPSQVMYVWFDALAIYLTAIGWGTDDQKVQAIWPPAVQCIGKGIARFHAIYWIGMLLSAGLALPRAISIHGYISSDGQKMSKSLGNVIDPFVALEKYGNDPLRYYLLKHIPTHGDGDFSHQSFREVYTSDLANGIGNVCSRVASLAEKAGISMSAEDATSLEYHDAFAEAMQQYRLSDALAFVLEQSRETDSLLSAEKPWLDSTSEHGKNIITQAVRQVLSIGYHLQPFLPDTAASILKHFTTSPITRIPKPLFPRLEESA